MNINELKIFLENNSNASSINLYNQGINADMAIIIADFLKSNNSVTSLFLGYNNIGDKGAEVIVEALKINKSLTLLSLFSSGIKADGAVAIAEALKSNNSLTKLYIEGNTIGNKGAIAIAKALENGFVVNTSLSYCGIGNEGAEAVARAIEKNIFITIVGFDNNFNVGKDKFDLKKLDEKITKKIQSDLDSHKELVKKTAEKFSEQFENKEKQIPKKYLKIYQKCDKDLLKEHLEDILDDKDIRDDEKISQFVKKVELDSKERLFENLFKEFKVKVSKESITKHPFELKEIVTQISEFLGPKNLWATKVVFKSLAALKSRIDSSKLKITNDDKYKKLFDDKKEKITVEEAAKKLIGFGDNELSKLVKQYCEDVNINIGEEHVELSGSSNHTTLYRNQDLKL